MPHKHLGSYIFLISTELYMWCPLLESSRVNKHEKIKLKTIKDPSIYLGLFFKTIVSTTINFCLQPPPATSISYKPLTSIFYHHYQPWTLILMKTISGFFLPIYCGCRQPPMAGSNDFDYVKSEQISGVWWCWWMMMVINQPIL